MSKDVFQMYEKTKQSTREGYEYVEDIMNSKEHITGEGMSSLYILTPPWSISQMFLYIGVGCTLLKGVYWSGSDQGGEVDDYLVKLGFGLWD